MHGEHANKARVGRANERNRWGRTGEELGMRAAVGAAWQRPERMPALHAKGCARAPACAGEHMLAPLQSRLEGHFDVVVRALQQHLT